MGKRRTAWNFIPQDESFYDETDVVAWDRIEVGRRGVDSILSIGYDLRSRAEMEEWASDHGFSIEWR